MERWIAVWSLALALGCERLETEGVKEPPLGGTAAGPTVDTGGGSDSSPLGLHPILGGVVHLPGGSFLMGSPAADPDGGADEKPQHQVTLSPFSIMEREVSQRLYEDVTGDNPASFLGCSDCPVETVSWDDAVAFAAAVGALTGEEWRLPTEAEWEYAARSDESYAYAGSADPAEVAWTTESAGGTTHPGCALARNGFGLCDMSGNVFEWTSDWYGSYDEAPAIDPTGPESGSIRVARGGSWENAALYARVAYRANWAPSNRYAYLGLRLVRSESR